ncbi:multidrug effflux MFS transporter [Acidimangrovimonas pyrenivorans]|uniref:Multidrug effflux MFS transporter n=1 Tax=Acidimangrovimonas pyrenivorans TaxID=2030798 RepID=A0ABV7AEG6_9RHOB
MLSPVEFIAMIAMLFATVAFSIDSMLPALPEIGRQLTPDDLNRAQLILTSFVLGMGVGTFFAGPISDAIGRKQAILGGAVLYTIGAALASMAQTLELVLAARVLQGLGAAGPRVVALAMVRDLHAGRQMARVMSFAMMVFTLVPAIAPAMSTFIIDAFGWRGIFGAFITFSLISSLWLGLRQPETLPVEARRPMRLAPLLAALREVLTHRVVVTAIAVQTLAFAALFGTLSSTQQIFDISYGRGESFPAWFAMIAIMAGSASFLNAQLVVRLGMRRMISTTLLVQLSFSALMTVLTHFELLPEMLRFPAYLVWTTGIFFMAGLVLGNLNALAMEPMGHIAGMAASIVGAIATVLAVGIAAPIGLAFNGTPVPLMASIAVLCTLGWGLMQTIPRN